jgi:beta-glucanase (GH16 family)
VLDKSTVPDPEHAWVFDHEYYLLMNLAMGGTFGGAIDSKLTESNMSINWVKFSTINGVGELIRH